VEQEQASEPEPVSDRQDEPAQAGEAATVRPGSTVDESVGRADDLSGVAGVESDYRSRLRAAILEQQSYPRQARRRRLKGTVVIEFRVDANGSTSELVVRTSSGAAVLDNAALQAVRDVGRFEPFPSEVSDLSLLFVVPISFRLP